MEEFQLPIQAPHLSRSKLPKLKPYGALDEPAPTFAAYDLDGDGSISAAEFERATTRKGAAAAGVSPAPRAEPEVIESADDAEVDFEAVRRKLSHEDTLSPTSAPVDASPVILYGDLTTDR